MHRTIASLILLINAVPVLAQIDLPAEHQLGKRIVATSQAEAKGYSWHCETADLLTEGGTCFVWAREGQHQITLVTVDEDYTIRRFDQQFEVTDSPAPPTPATLRELVSDAEAKLIAEYLRVLAGQVGGIRDAEHFWLVWQQTFPVRGNAKLDAALQARITPALAKKTGLSVELRTIADEFEKESPKPPTPPVVEPTEPATSVVYIHEKDQSAVPSEVMAGLNKINREKGIRATLFEDDSKTGSETVPEQYQVPLEAAQAAGLPALVVMAGSNVLKVVRNWRGDVEAIEVMP